MSQFEEDATFLREIAAPTDFDKNFGELCGYLETGNLDFKGDDVRICNCEPSSIKSKQVQNQGKIDTHTSSEDDYPTSESDLEAFNIDPATDDPNPNFQTLEDLENTLTQQYKEEAHFIHNRTDLSFVEKLEKLNDLYRSWITDLYTQRNQLSLSLEEIEQVAKTDRKEMEKVVKSFQEKAQDCQSKWEKAQRELQHCNKELDRKSCIIQMLTDLNKEERLVNMEAKDKVHSEAQDDLNALIMLFRRFMEKRVFDPTGLKFTLATESLVFEGNENLIGKRFILSEECLSPTLTSSQYVNNEEYQKRLGVCKDKLFVKGLQIQKLNIEAAKLRVQALKSHANVLANTVEQLQVAQNSLEDKTKTKTKTKMNNGRGDWSQSF